MLPGGAVPCRCRAQDWSGARSPPAVQRTHPRLVRRGVRRADARAVGRVGGDRRGPARPGGGADRVRQDPQRLPVEHRPAAHRTPPRGQAAPLPGALHLPAEGARRRRRAQPPRAADRHPAHRRAPRHERAGGQRRRALRGHAGRGPAQAGHQPPGRPDHHARVAVPHAHQPGAGVAARRGDGDPRRGPRRGRHQAWCPPRGQPRAPRRAAGPAGPAHRAVGDRAAAGGGGPLPRRQRTGRDRRPTVGEGVGPGGRRPRRGHDRARGVRRGGRRPAALPEHLAARRGARRRPHRAAPVDHRVRQLPPARRAADRAVQRDRVEPGGQSRTLPRS